MTKVKCNITDCVYLENGDCSREEIELDNTHEIFECFNYYPKSEKELWDIK